LNFLRDVNLMQQDFERARQLYLSGMLYDSLQACVDILSLHPDQADTLNLLGMLCFRGGDQAAALTYFQQAVQASPIHAEALGNLALCYKGAGRMDDALAVYEQALALDPDDAQVHYNYGLALRLTHQLERAADHLSRAAEIAPLLNDVFNLLGIVRSEMDQPELAILAFRNALTASPQSSAPYLNLSSALTEAGQLGEAIKILMLATSVHGLQQMGRQLAATQEAANDYHAAVSTLSAYVMIKNDDADAWESMGDLYFRLGRFEDSLHAFLQAVALDEKRSRAHMQIFSIAQILERPALALEHQTRALKLTRLFSEPGKNPDGPVLLVLKAAGDWQVNTPTDFILNPKDWACLHYYFLDEARPVQPDIPDCDLVFNAIAEPDRASAALKAAATIIAYLDRPCINDPNAMAKATRDNVAKRLASLPHTIVPQAKRVSSRAELEGLQPPFLLRPAGTHAGQGMILIADQKEIPEFVDGIHYAIPYVDYGSADGQFRKYRVVVVDGVPYPFHLGLSVNWMVHYANAKPLDPCQMDLEEQAFLTDIHQVFSPPLLADLSQMARILDLDFFAVDCAIHQDGRLVLFEVDAGAIIHTMDDPNLFAYKHQYVPQIFAALRQAILKKIKA
jgi:tetratricopeptide (TPR) repeat protein